MPLFTNACAICTYWILKSVYPFLDAWMILFSSWFLALSIVRTVTREPLRWVPKVGWGIALLGASLLIALFFIGPVIGFWIPIACLAGTASALNPRRTEAPFGRRRVRRLSAILAGIFTSLLVATAAHATWRESRQSSVERCLALQYPAVFPAALNRLERESPAPCRDLQEVFQGLTYPYHATRTLTALERTCTSDELTDYLEAVASGGIETRRPETRQSAEEALKRRAQEIDR